MTYPKWIAFLSFKSLVILTCLLGSLHSEAQVGLGGVLGLDFYQRYTNPTDNIASPSAGNAILNFALGPKIWIGHKKVSVSAEAPVNIGLTGFSTGYYKGLGMLAVPVIGSLNFGSLSSMTKEGGTGVSIGGGVQWYKTELFGVSEKFANQGVTRGFQRVYVVQAAIGFGVTGFAGSLYARYGFDPDNSDLRTFNIGFMTDFNFVMMRKIHDPASEL